MGARIRSHDWAASPVGSKDGWPQSLKTLVGVVLNAHQPMFLAWGAERTLIYNDAYAHLLGEKHGDALGRPFFDVWPEVRDEVGSLFDQVFAGKPVHMDDIELTLQRHGYPEEAHFAFSYTPVPHATGQIEGLFCACTETTQQVLADRLTKAERYRQQLLLQQMPGFVGLLAGPEHIFEYVNDAYVAIAGRRAFLGRNVRQVFPELEGQGFYELLDRVYATAEPFAARAMPISLAGEDAKRYIDFLYQPVLNDDGAVTGVFVGGYDITERVRAEEMLRATEQRQAFLLALGDRLRDFTDPRATMKAAVDAIGRHLGVSRVGYGLVHEDGHNVTLETEYLDSATPLVGTYPMAAFGPGNIANLRAGTTSVFADVEKEPGMSGIGLGAFGISALVAVPLMRQGRLRSVLYVNHREPREWLSADVELVEQVAARIWDAVERARADTARRESEEQFRVFAQAMPNQVWAASANGDLYWFNDQVYAYSGAKPGGLDGAAWTGIVHPDDLETAARGWVEALATGEHYESEFRIRRFDEIYRWFLVRAEPIRGPDRTVQRWVGTNTDIHDQKRTAAELSSLNETLEQRVEERTQELRIAEAALRQSQKMEAVGQLTGGLAHDFNNLLTGITGSLDLMSARITQGRFTDVERYVAAAQGAAKRAASLTHRLLAFSRQQTLDPKPTDVNRLVAGMEELVRRTVGPAVVVEFVAAGGLWATMVDQNQLENALLNLSINARDAMPDGGRLTIETGNRWLDDRAARERELSPGQYVSLCVSDTGTGMTPDVIAKAFDPFFTTKPIGQGTGLGLSMIYGFARQSNGQVRIYSEPGDGTMVCIYLPRHRGHAEEAETAAELAEAPRAEAGETVMVVDDEPTVRMLVTEVLEELGYAAIEAADAASGLKVLRSDTRIDLLVTDVGLPGGMNGRQMADAARVVRPDLKVLFITGFAENAVVGNGHLAPGMHVMTKPFAMEALATRIKALIVQ